MKKFLFIALAAAALIFGAVANAQTQINQANISSFPVVITKPGSYILTSNLNVTSTTSNAINIQASNVTLNLNGFSITGPNSCNATSCSGNVSGYGIYASSAYTGTTVENGAVSGFYFDVLLFNGNIHDLALSSSIICLYAFNSTIRHNLVTYCPTYGVYTQFSTVTENSFTLNGTGLYAVNSSVFNNSAANNTYGIALSSGVAGANISASNTAPSNADLNLANNALSTKTNACSSGAC